MLRKFLDLSKRRDHDQPIVMVFEQSMRGRHALIELLLVLDHASL